MFYRTFGVCLAVAVVALGAYAAPDSGGGAYLLMPEGDVTIERPGATAEIATEAVTLKDLDVIKTGPAGRAEIRCDGGWTATLAADSRATLRALPERTASGVKFRRSLELLDGGVTWKAGADSILVAGHARLRAQTAQVRVIYKDAIVIDAVDGLVSIELIGDTTYVVLKGGQRFEVRFDTSTQMFNFKILEDNGDKFEVHLGRTVIQVTKGDIFQARVDGDNLDLAVQQGIVQVTGPDARPGHVSQGFPYTVIGGAAGSIQGPLVGQGRPAGLDVPREPRRDPYKDVSDVSPSGSK
ncbi:MAG: hypothetical protein HY716_14655 [Planctomycetes bacterium]|nr:hypothetical protein [Planctomycetota bacterium]